MKLIFKVLHINEYFETTEPSAATSTAAISALESGNYVKARSISMGSITNTPSQMISFDEKDLGDHVELGDEFEITITRKTDSDWPVNFQ